MQPEEQDLGDSLDADSVMRYLTLNPEFFNQHAEVLPRLSIPHHTGKAISLIEKQVSVLRSKCNTLENSLRDLINVARDNEQLHQRLHVLIQDVISARSLNDVVALTRDNLLSNFNADDVRVLLFSSDQNVDDEIADYTMLPDGHDGIKLFAELFKKAETLCGKPTSDITKLVFDDVCDNIASAALVPLQYERQIGVIVLTSKDEERFAAGKGVMFLNQLGEVLSRRVDTLM